MSFDPNFENQPLPEVEITMTEEERRSHRSVFSRVCIAFLVYLLLTNALSVAAVFACNALAPELLESYNFSLLMSAGIQYVIGLPIFILMMRKIPAAPPTANALGAKRFFKYALVSMTMMYAGNYISTTIMMYMNELFGIVPEDSLGDMLGGTNILLSLVIVGIIGPIVEEIMFRKLFIDRLTPYGEVIAIFFPAVIFGLFHGNLYQLFYATFLGAAFGYIYLRSGKLIYSTLLHMFINTFCGVFPTVIMGMFDYDEFLEILETGAVTPEYVEANAVALALLLIYEFVVLSMVFGGIFMIVRNIMTLRLRRGEVTFPRGKTLETLLFNVGAIALITVSVIIMAINTFS